jgi:hypothetical protein
MKGQRIMSDEITETQGIDTPKLKEKIGNTEYCVGIHFRADTTETMNDKVKRMIMLDVENM